VNERILIHLTERSPKMRSRRAVSGIPRGADDADQQRLLRETVRLEKSGGDVWKRYRVAIEWLAPRLKVWDHAMLSPAPRTGCAGPTGRSPSRINKLAAIGRSLGSHSPMMGGAKRHFTFADSVASWIRPHSASTGKRSRSNAAMARINGA